MANTKMTMTKRILMTQGSQSLISSVKIINWGGRDGIVTSRERAWLQPRRMLSPNLPALLAEGVRVKVVKRSSTKSQE